MFKKITASALVMMLLMSILSIGAMAAPHTEINIGDGVSLINATDFDEYPYYETNYDEVQHGVREHGVQTEMGENTVFYGNIGWTAAGEWVQYTVNVAADGTYSFEVYVASGADNGAVQLSLGDTVIGTSDDYDSDGWQDYHWSNVGEIDITAGTHVIRAYFPDGEVNFAGIRVTHTGDTEAAAGHEYDHDHDHDNNETAADHEHDHDHDNNEIADNEDNNAADDDDNNMILWIILAIVAVVIIAVIVIFATKKKK